MDIPSKDIAPSMESPKKKRMTSMQARDFISGILGKTVSTSGALSVGTTSVKKQAAPPRCSVYFEESTP